MRDRLTVGKFGGDDIAEGDTDSARVERRLRQRKYTQEIRSLTGSLDHRFGNAWKLHLEAAHSRATDDTPDAISDARFRGADDFEGIGFTNGRTPRLVAPDAVFDPASYELNTLALERSHASDTTRQLRLDLQRDFELGDWGGAVKFGAKATRRDKDNDTDAWEYGSDDPEDGDYFGAGPTSLSAFAGPRQLDYKLGSIGYAIDPALVRARLAG
ncbi:MAG TPA: TonB-dependent receptor, partial [Massilia sp.]|nr:TonB-dependent receptor [Massilia sp.]